LSSKILTFLAKTICISALNRQRWRN